MKEEPIASSFPWHFPDTSPTATCPTASFAAALLNGRLFPRLRRLSLDHNLMGDEGMGSLASALESGLDLDELYVECNPASDEATKKVNTDQV